MIEYSFKLDDETEMKFSVDPDRTEPLVDPASAPDWCKLDYEKCSNCPLDSSEHPQCPAAVDASDLLDRFTSMLSFHKADVTVETDERTYFRRSDIQTSLHSVLGLIMATSGCPHLSRLRPMAKYHLPFATKEETVFRTASVHLMRQYFRHKSGGKADLELDELRQLYQDLQEVNRAFTERIRAAAKRDANLNAIVLLFSLSVLVGYTLDDELEQFKELFAE
jgi:hypothetical protein